MKNNLIFIGFALAVILVLFMFSGKRTPRVPSDGIHKGITNTAVCMECHGPDKKYARKKEHPPKDQCLICHKVKRTR